MGWAGVGEGKGPFTQVLGGGSRIGQGKGPFTEVLGGGSRRSGKGAFYSGIRGWVQE